MLEKLFKGDHRSSLIKKNIVGSFAIKAWSGLAQLLLVPVSLNCLTKEEYGVWLVINSILIAVSYMDIGLGNGLRNKLAESLAQNDREKSQKLVSTTFYMLSFMVIPAIVIAYLVIYGIDLYEILNCNKESIPNLADVLFVSFALTAMTFAFKFIGNVYLALQLPAINNLINVMGLTVSLVGIAILGFAGKSGLMPVAAIFTASPLLVYIISYPITFKVKYKYLCPKYSLFDKKELKGLFSLGISFFFIQIAGIVLFQSSSIIISNVLSPNEVVPFQVSYRYYTLASMIIAIISAPLWAATTDAYTKGELDWMRTTEKKVQKVILGCAILLFIMTIISPWFYMVWVGNKVEIPPLLSVLMAIYTLVIAFSSCYSNMIYGTGKIRLILILTVLEAILYVPLGYYLGMVWGIYGIILALIIVTPICAIANFIQFKKIVNGRASGIWGR